jgi:hypothetical protein
VALIVLIPLAGVAVIVGWMVRRLVRGNDEPVAAGSFGRQFFGRRARASKPDDWLD